MSGSFSLFTPSHYIPVFYYTVVSHCNIKRDRHIAAFIDEWHSLLKSNLNVICIWWFPSQNLLQSYLYFMIFLIQIIFPFFYLSISLFLSSLSGAMTSTAGIVGSASKGIGFLSGDAEYVRKRSLKNQQDRWGWCIVIVTLWSLVIS